MPITLIFYDINVRMFLILNKLFPISSKIKLLNINLKYFIFFPSE